MLTSIGTSVCFPRQCNSRGKYTHLLFTVYVERVCHFSWIITGSPWISVATNQSTLGGNAAGRSPWLCWQPLPFRGEFFFPAVAKYCSWRLIGSRVLSLTVRCLPYTVVHLGCDLVQSIKLKLTPLFKNLPPPFSSVLCVLSLAHLGPTGA